MSDLHLVFIVPINPKVLTTQFSSRKTRRGEERRGEERRAPYMIPLVIKDPIILERLEPYSFCSGFGKTDPVMNYEICNTHTATEMSSSTLQF
jgi:hypothetical protein